MNNLTSEERIKLIDEMIAQTRNNTQKGAGNVMIICGYCVAIIALLNILLVYTLEQPQYAAWIWLLSIPMTIVSLIINKKKDRRALVKTQVDKIMSKTWIAFLLSNIALLTVIFSSFFVFDTWLFAVLITPVILIMLGSGQYITGVIMGFRPFYYGSGLFWIGAILCIVLYPIIHQTGQFVILAICMIAGFAFPGHALNRKAEKDV